MDHPLPPTFMLPLHSWANPGCRILNAYKSEKSHVPLFLKVEVANKGSEQVWLAPAHHITDLYYDSGESHTLRLGLRCKLSRAQTPGALLIGAILQVEIFHRHS